MSANLSNFEPIQSLVYGSLSLVLLLRGKYLYCRSAAGSKDVSVETETQPSGNTDPGRSRELR